MAGKVNLIFMFVADYCYEKPEEQEGKRQFHNYTVHYNFTSLVTL